MDAKELEKIKGKTIFDVFNISNNDYIVLNDGTVLWAVSEMGSGWLEIVDVRERERYARSWFGDFI